MAKRRFRTFPPRKLQYNYHTSCTETKQKAHCIINETYYVSLVMTTWDGGTTAPVSLSNTMRLAAGEGEEWGRSGNGFA
jgi:hypothetical protein